MFVKLRRPWFNKDGVHYPAHVWLEIGDDQKDALPSGAEVADTLPGGKKEMPTPPEPVPGFGALPEEEQALADVGAAPTHQTTIATGVNLDVDVEEEEKDSSEPVKDPTKSPPPAEAKSPTSSKPAIKK